MQLKRVLVNGNPVVVTPKKINLEAVNNDVVLDFKPITNDSALYFYRLKELNKRWSESMYPSAHYQNLSGGIYTFEIYAKTKNTTTKASVMRIEVKAAFWQKAWFWPAIAFYVLLIMGVGFYLFFLYDFRQKLKLQYIRNQIASDLHDEVGANLSSIAIFVELLRQKAAQNPALMPILDKITSNSEETVALMRDTVWAINPSNDSTEKLLEKMRSFGLEILSAKGIPFDFQSSLDAQKETFSMEQRRNLYLIYKEAINNIAKHAQATKASCAIRQQQGIVIIKIEDNGIGFDLQKTFQGNGLNNFKLRSLEEDINVHISSQLKEGTQVAIEIRL